MNIAIVLIHNKGNLANFNQIETLKPLITKVVGEYSTYTIKGLAIPHKLRVYQILPFGVPEPANFYSLDSHNVLYRKGDENKTGDHPRFFNWGLKRGTDYGADLVIHTEDITKLNFATLSPKFVKLANPLDTTEYVEDPSCKIATVRLLKQVGGLNENRTKTQAILDLKNALISKGFTNG